MNFHLPTLLIVCTVAVAASAAVMTLYAATQRTYRGMGWWVSAQWLLTLGCLLQMFRDAAPELLPLANLLLLQWPVVVLGGMRRFTPRHPSRVPQAVDALLLAAAWLAWLAVWAAEGAVAARVAAFAAGACLLHLYGATLVWHMPERRASVATRMLVGIELAAAVLQALRVSAALALPPASPFAEGLLLASGLVIVISSLVMVYLALMLTNERSEAQLHEMHRQLRFLADIDVLTRVPNRRHFHELAARTLAEGVAAPCALMMLDVDHFKRINDEQGHAAGDAALREVGGCVREALRAPDIAGRLGGDEFAVLLPGTAVDDAIGVAGRIVARLGQRHAAQGGPALGLSFGVVQLQADESLDEALRRADQALYEAKRQGRSRAVPAFGAEDQPVFGESRPLGLPSLPSL
ncbi:MAG: GGDEF domain-containing protein [Piscinibacter sp.]|uniref:GGDEF domain-containing protein n=1 Tax=Piscinibacter sp. TaxID=1903157 RepID=UPI0035B2A7D6